MQIPRTSLKQTAKSIWAAAHIRSWWKWLKLPSPDAPDPMVDILVGVYKRAWNAGHTAGVRAERFKQAAADKDAREKKAEKLATRPPVPIEVRGHFMSADGMRHIWVRCYPNGDTRQEGKHPHTFRAEHDIGGSMDWSAEPLGSPAIMWARAHRWAVEANCLQTAEGKTVEESHVKWAEPYGIKDWR